MMLCRRSGGRSVRSDYVGWPGEADILERAVYELAISGKHGTYHDRPVRWDFPKDCIWGGASEIVVLEDSAFQDKNCRTPNLTVFKREALKDAPCVYQFTDLEDLPDEVLVGGSGDFGAHGLAPYRASRGVG